VLLEPTETGQRLRFRTFNGAAQASITTGLASIGVATAVAIATALSGSLAHAVPGLAFLGTVGIGMIANGVVRLPRWAKLRGHQMEALAAGVAASSPRQLPPTSNRE
jgi:hypothetical protein